MTYDVYADRRSVALAATAAGDRHRRHDFRVMAIASLKRAPKGKVDTRDRKELVAGRSIELCRIQPGREYARQATGCRSTPPTRGRGRHSRL
jgi:hypothetical protein